MAILDIWEMSLDGTLKFLIHTWTFLAITYVASQLFLCLFWISLWLKNRCLQHPCFKNLYKIIQASKNSNLNAQHFLSDLLSHSWFHSMLFALPSYKFPYIVMNRCLYLSDIILVWTSKHVGVNSYRTLMVGVGKWNLLSISTIYLWLQKNEYYNGL